jgi:hypothetical protein
MNINPFKQIARLDAEMEAIRESYTTLLVSLPAYWDRLAKVEKQITAAMATASTNMGVMTKLPSIAAVEEAIGLATKFDGRLDRVRDRLDRDLLNAVTRVRDLEAEMDARMVGAGHLDKRLTALAEDVVLLKALRNVVTPEAAARKTVDAQIARDQAKLEYERIKQREYNAAYRARQKAKAAEEAKRIKKREYKRAWTARKKAEQAAAQTTPGAHNEVL